MNGAPKTPAQSIDYEAFLKEMKAAGRQLPSYLDEPGLVPQFTTEDIIVDAALGGAGYGLARGVGYLARKAGIPQLIKAARLANAIDDVVKGGAKRSRLVEVAQDGDWAVPAVLPPRPKIPVAARRGESVVRYATPAPPVRQAPPLPLPPARPAPSKVIGKKTLNDVWAEVIDEYDGLQTRAFGQFSTSRPNYLHRDAPDVTGMSIPESQRVFGDDILYLHGVSGTDRLSHGAAYTVRGWREAIWQAFGKAVGASTHKAGVEPHLFIDEGVILGDGRIYKAFSGDAGTVVKNGIRDTYAGHAAREAFEKGDIERAKNDLLMEAVRMGRKKSPEPNAASGDTQDLFGYNEVIVNDARPVGLYVSETSPYHKLALMHKLHKKTGMPLTFIRRDGTLGDASDVRAQMRSLLNPAIGYLDRGLTRHDIRAYRRKPIPLSKMRWDSRYPFVDE